VTAWQASQWSQIPPKKLPDLQKVLARRRPRRRHRLTMEEDIARWESFFGKAGKARH
jgi:hypothetical protein